MAADGSIILDVDIDENQISAEYKKLVNNLKKVKAEMDKLDKTSTGKALAGNLEKAQKQSDILADKLERLNAEKEALEAKATVTPLKESDSKKLDKINESIATTDKQFLKSIADIETYEAKITEAQTTRAQKQELLNEKYGIATQKLKEFTDKQEELKKAESITGRVAAGFEKLNKRIRKLATRALVFSVITRGLRRMRDYIMRIANTMPEFTQASAGLKASLMTLAQPILEVVVPALTTLMNVLSKAFTYLAQFVALLSGKSYQAMKKNAKAANQRAGAFGGVGKSAEKSLASFDTINKLESGAGGGGAGADLGAAFDNFDKGIEKSSLLGRALEAIGRILVVLGQGIQLFYDSFLSPLVEKFKELGAAAGEWLVPKLEAMARWFEANSQKVAEFVAIMTTVLVAVGILALLHFTAGKVFFIFDKLKNLFIRLFGFLGVKGAILLGIITLLSLLVVWAGNGTEALGYLKDAFKFLLEFITNVFQGNWEAAWRSMGNFFISGINLLIVAFESFVKFIVTGINKLGELAGKFKFDIPEWVPKWGGKTYSLGWNPISTDFKLPRVPYLAQGAVIPPNAPFMAMLGDQRNGTNIETPLSTMVEAFRIAQQGQNINITFTGDLAQLARVLKPIIDKENNRVGGSLVKGVL